MARQIALYGTWKSPLTLQMMAGNNRLNDVQWDSDGVTLVWHETRAGIGTLIAQTGTDAPHVLTGNTTRVSGGLGYGGGEFTVSHGHVVYAADKRLWRLPIQQGMARAITPPSGAVSSPAVSHDGRWVAYLQSDEGVDRVLVVDGEGTRLPQILAAGSDFVAQPTWHPQATHLAYIAWHIPNMPWNASELRLITLAYDTQGNPYNAIEETLVSAEDIAICQPQFSPDGRYLSYISDATGWGHIYLHDLADGGHQQITEGDYEHGLPNWVMGLRQYAWAEDGRSLTYIRAAKGFFSVWRYDLNTQSHSRVEGLEEYTHLHHIAISSKGDNVALIASSGRIPARILTISRGEGIRVVHRSTSERLNPATLADCEAISWATGDGETAHGLYFAPANPDYEGIGLPPLIVLVHGGPTSQRNAEYEDQVHFFSTRGVAVLQVNHRGSTGYGKAYMNRHRHSWGVYDVDDSKSGALYLAGQGLIDRSKMVIMGGSAGGFTVLMMLAHHSSVFKAGINLYGVANQFTIAMDADFKFENHYYDWLLGSLPDHAARWRASSPVFDAHQIKDAMLVLQGNEDNVVPKSQSDEIVAALKRNGVPHEYVVYEGEGHGFRKPATIVDMYTKIERFLKQYVVFAV